MTTELFLLAIFTVYVWADSGSKLSQACRMINYQLVTIEEAIENLDNRLDDVEDKFRAPFISEDY